MKKYYVSPDFELVIFKLTDEVLNSLETNQELEATQNLDDLDPELDPEGFL